MNLRVTNYEAAGRAAGNCDFQRQRGGGAIRQGNFGEGGHRLLQG